MIAFAKINSMTFWSFPDNDIERTCIFVITLSDKNYDSDGNTGERSMTKGAKPGYVGYAEVFYGKDPVN